MTQRLLRLLALGDVAGHAQDTDKIALRITHGRFDGLHQALTPVGLEDQFLLVDGRLSRSDGLLVIVDERAGLFQGDEIRVGSAQNRLLGRSVQFGERIVARQIDPIWVLEPDQFGNGVQHRPQQDLGFVQGQRIRLRSVTSRNRPILHSCSCTRSRKQRRSAWKMWNRPCADTQSSTTHAAAFSRLK